MEARSLEILSFGSTDVGRKRRHNEDSYLADDDARIYVVADGMGGHLGGEVASSLAVHTIHDEILAGREKLPPLELLPRAIIEASRKIFALASVRPDLEGMGTTVTGITFADGLAFIAHVGDSRVYRIRGDRIEQLSKDHSLVAEQVEAGLISPELASKSPFRHVISRSVGVEARVEVDASVLPMEEGDVFVLCSDGLSNALTAEEIKDVVRDNFLRDAPRRLIQLANQRGGEDNITVLVLYVNAEN